MTYREFLKGENKYLYIVVDMNDIECSCSRFNVAESVLNENVEFNPDSKRLKFVNRAAVNGRIETAKEFDRHLKMTNKEQNPDSFFQCFMLILLTAIVRVFLS